MDGTSYYRRGPHKSHTSITTGRRLESRTKDLGFKSNTRRINSQGASTERFGKRLIRLRRRYGLFWELEFAQDENWIDKLLDQAVDVPKICILGKTFGWNYEYDPSGGFNDVNYTLLGSCPL